MARDEVVGYVLQFIFRKNSFLSSKPSHRNHSHSKQSKTKPSSNMAHYVAVRLISLLCNEFCQASVCSGTFRGHSTCGIEYEWGEGGSLNISDTIKVLVLLESFILSMQTAQWLLHVGVGCWMRNLNVEKCLLVSTPHAACWNIASCLGCCCTVYLLSSYYYYYYLSLPQTSRIHIHVHRFKKPWRK